MKNKKATEIQELIQSSNKVTDIRYSINGKTIFYIAFKDGIGELFQLDGSGRSIKVSKDFNVRGTVGYGGGDFDVSENYIIFCEKSGSIYRIESKRGHPTSQITFNTAKSASPKISHDENKVMFVYDQNEISGIEILTLNDLNRPSQLIQGADFYMHPTWHPNGRMIAWAEWDHPHMPWDASRIMISYVEDNQLENNEKTFIDGFFGESASQPQFSPDGQWLSYIKRSENWDDLVLFNVDSQQKKVIIKGDGFHLRIPDWVQGNHSYQWSGDSTSIFFIKYHHGTSSISKINLNNSKVENLELFSYTWVSQLSVSKSYNEIAFIGSSQMESDQIVRISESKSIPFSVTARKKQPHVSEGQEIAFPTEENSTAFAWFYPSLDITKNDELSACIIYIHSGPTSVRHLGYALETEIFNSHGYAVAYLNYHGSVTYGYDYQDSLQKRWGDIEVQDAVCLVKHLISHEIVNPQKIAVMGSSAGGFSVLNLLINYPGLFQAGICSYAVSDLVDDAQNTHKFEKFYHRFLTGEFPAEYEKFVSRSPISRLDKISDPLVLFHGSEDKVVSPNQSQKIFDSLSRRGIPCELKIYKDEGHGFRKQENIVDFYKTIFNFLNTHLKLKRGEI